MSDATSAKTRKSDPHGGITDRIKIEPAGKHLRAVLAGEVIAESAAALVMHETGYPPRVYFPIAQVRAGVLERNDHKTYCPFKGDAAYWTVRAGGERLENGAWGYPDPKPEVAAIRDRVSFYDEVTVEG
jgi:uncharacterized protein (DUF427 family)